MYIPIERNLYTYQTKLIYLSTNRYIVFFGVGECLFAQGGGAMSAECSNGAIGASWVACRAGVAPVQNEQVMRRAEPICRNVT